MAIDSWLEPSGLIPPTPRPQLGLDRLTYGHALEINTEEWPNWHLHDPGGGIWPGMAGTNGVPMDWSGHFLGWQQDTDTLFKVRIWITKHRGLTLTIHGLIWWNCPSWSFMQQHSAPKLNPSATLRMFIPGGTLAGLMVSSSGSRKKPLMTSAADQ